MKVSKASALEKRSSFLLLVAEELLELSCTMQEDESAGAAISAIGALIGVIRVSGGGSKYHFASS